MPLIGTFGAGSGKAFGFTGASGFPFNIEYLVIAGGGAGGLQAGGGAGAGGYRLNTGETSGGGSPVSTALEVITGDEYSITIGAGGVSYGPAPTYPITVPPTPGTASVFAGITSLPGGHGGGYSESIVDDGNAPGTVGSSAARSSTSIYYEVPGNQGYRGGNHGSHSGPAFGGGGGGGAGSEGTQGGSSCGVGGNGLASSITGSSVTRGGGGGGGGRVAAPGGAGGPGGGGAGSNSSPSNASPGTVNTGGGGGSEGYSQASHGTGGSGGSGFIALKVPSAITASFSPGVTSSLSTAVPGYKIYSVTATSTGSETVKFSKG
jgi:hypothetical protein